MTRDDVDPAVTAILADHWGDRRAWFEFTLGNAACHSIVADADGEVIGTGVATVNGPVAWIGTIWVARDHRRRGLGAALTDAVADIATAEGAGTLLLVATDRGRPLYERSGFEVQTWYRTFEAPGLGAAADEALRPFRPDDLDAMAALDRAATGEDRRLVLDGLATPTGTRVLEASDGDLRGFVVRAPWGGGATVAPGLDDGLTIVEARRRRSPPEKRVRCGILLENEAGAEALERAGWTEAWRAPRLVRGASMTWHPEQVWGQFNHAMG
jgi:GNAT superfamily N-acetyltransferase